MQIAINIEIVCAKCYKPHAVELKPGFEPESNKYIYRTVPQCKCHLDITDKKTCPLLGDECDRADEQIGDLLCDGCIFINNENPY